jgi:hypothetical protein
MVFANNPAQRANCHHNLGYFPGPSADQAVGSFFDRPEFQHITQNGNPTAI